MLHDHRLHQSDVQERIAMHLLVTVVTEHHYVLGFHPVLRKTTPRQHMVALHFPVSERPAAKRTAPPLFLERQLLQVTESFPATIVLPFVTLLYPTVANGEEKTESVHQVAAETNVSAQ